MQESDENTPEYYDASLKEAKALYFYFMNSIVEFTFYVYMNCFLMYLIVMFARENKNAESMDPILEKRVPNIVYLQN